MAGQASVGHRVSSSEAQQQEGSKLSMDQSKGVFNSSAVDEPREPEQPGMMWLQPQGQPMMYIWTAATATPFTGNRVQATKKSYTCHKTCSFVPKVLKTGSRPCLLDPAASAEPPAHQWWHLLQLTSYGSDIHSLVNC